MVSTIRKGARRMSEIPPAVLRQLELGKLETVNLVEWLAVDQRKLARIVLKEIGQQRLIDATMEAIANATRPTAVQHILVIGQELGKHLGPSSSSDSELEQLAQHRSDIVRSWGALAAVTGDIRPFREHLAAIRPFAADPHSGVREVAWLALRPHIVLHLTDAINLLTAWSYETDANLRRFASEATRPRGVWCSHLTLLKQDPQLGLPILEPLKSDDSKYVRDSVGNWLNDAAKSQPQFVRSLCRQWRKSSRTPETAYILRRALRSL